MAETQILTVKLPWEETWGFCFNANRAVSEAGCITTYEDPSKKNTYCAKITLPKNGFWKPDPYAKSQDTSQYAAKIAQEEEYHAKQFRGEVPPVDGGYGDLYSNKGVQFYLDRAGGNVLSGYTTANKAWAAAINRLHEAKQQVSTESERIAIDRRPYHEKKAKEAVGFKEAYSYQYAYPNFWSKWGANPPNPLPPWEQ
jgi:hypothetical protein